MAQSFPLSNGEYAMRISAHEMALIVESRQIPVEIFENAEHEAFAMNDFVTIMDLGL